MQGSKTGSSYSLLLILLALAVGCAIMPDPGVAMKDIDFAEQPIIVQRGEYYYLRYRIALQPGSALPLRRVLCHRRTTDKGYYYFSIPVSHTEWGNTVERPLAMDGFTDLARKDAMYWLNPDGTEVKLEIR